MLVFEQYFILTFTFRREQLQGYFYYKIPDISTNFLPYSTRQQNRQIK